MISEQTLSSPSSLPVVQGAADVPKVTHDEAHALAQVEHARLLAVVESLEGDDWAQPTYCDQWRVRELVSHLAGGAAAFSSLREFQRHFITNPHAKEWDKSEDACNYLQVTERAGRSPTEVVREFRELAPKEIRARHRLPWLVRQLPLPGASMTVGYLTDTVLVRDWWIHRLDLCHATGQEMVLTPEHDGRLTALVVHDMAKKVRQGLRGKMVEVHLDGPAGGTYRFGEGNTPTATITMDAVNFHLRASERITVEETCSRATIQGDAHVAKKLLELGTVLY